MSIGAREAPQLAHSINDALRFTDCEKLQSLDVNFEDSGKTFADDTLLGNEHVIGGLEANDLEIEPYLFRCTVTNGDGIAALTADVRIVVLDVENPAPASEDGGDYVCDGKSGGKRIPQLGDDQLASLAAIAGVFASLVLMLALMRPKKRE